MTFFGSRGTPGPGLGPNLPAIGPQVLAPPVAVAPGADLTARVVPLPASLADLFRYLARLLHAAIGLNPPPTAGGVNDATYQTELIQSVGSTHQNGGLRGMNHLARAYTAEASELLAMVRGLKGLADLLDEATIQASAPYYRSSGVYTSLRTAASALQTAVDNRVPGLSPLEATHPTFVRAWRTRAANLQTLLEEPEGLRVFRAFRDDAAISADDRRAVLDFARRAVAIAVDELSRSTRHEQIADRVEQALTTPSQDNLLGFVASLGSLATASVGALPGPDAASIVFIKVVGTLRLVSLHDNAPELRSLRDRLIRWVVRAAAFTEAERNQFTAQMAAFRIARAGELNDWSRNRDAARDLLGSKFQTGWRLSAALSVLNVIQLAAAIQGSPDGERNPLQAASDITAAGLAAISGTIVTLERAPIPVGRIREIIRVLHGGVEAANGTINRVFAITSIIGGSFTLAQGVEDHDPWTITVGGLQVASGIALMIPGGQPIAVVLAVVATAISARNAILDRIQDGMYRGYKKLFARLEAARSRWDEGSSEDETLFIHRLGVAAEVAALERAMDGTTFSTIHTGLSRSLWDSYKHRLRGLGVPEADARRMLRSDLLPPP